MGAKEIDMKRIYTAICMLVVVVFIVIFNNPALIWGVLGVAYGISHYESYRLYHKKSDCLDSSYSSYFFWVGAALFWISLYYLQNFYMLFIVMILFASYQAYTRKGEITQIMPFIYPGIPFAFLYLLYLDYSIRAIIWLLFIVGLTDSFAYFGGKMFGGKMFVKSAFCATSPNKTKEGVLIGIVGSLLIATWFGVGLINFFTALLLTFFVSVSSVFGDLYESFLKRQAGVKDSGKIFPGHGGMLDRLDGYFFGGVVLYVLLEVFKGAYI